MMITEHVTRYVPTYINKDGLRTLMRPAQGRDTFPTREEAQLWLDAVAQNNSADHLRSIWGEDPRFEVRACACWAAHFDPVGIYFDEPACINAEERIRDAAPDLLAAAEAMDTALSLPCTNREREALSKLRNAIAKAKGRPQPLPGGTTEGKP